MVQGLSSLPGIDAGSKNDIALTRANRTPPNSNDDLLFRRAFQHLVPGGHIELRSVFPRFLSDDETAAKAKDAQFWMKNIFEGAAKFGKPLDSAAHWMKKLRDAGFVDVQQDVRSEGRTRCDVERTETLTRTRARPHEPAQRADDLILP
ncbi:hypothetical protein DL769_006045 [Monosporascus sp. CRB-8-3]|nr:hypothetical protein DL769_006045 [Monosporascus sp. CRB-8-3]